MVFEAIVFWVVGLALLAAVVYATQSFPLIGVVTKGIEGFLRIWVWVLVIKAADVTVTVWAYAHGLGWMEGNPCLIAIEGSPEWSVWVIPQFLLGWGGLLAMPGILAISFWRPEGRWMFVAVFLWLWGAVSVMFAATLPFISWAYGIFVRDGYTILP